MAKLQEASLSLDPFKSKEFGGTSKGDEIAESRRKQYESIARRGDMFADETQGRGFGYRNPRTRAVGNELTAARQQGFLDRVRKQEEESGKADLYGDDTLAGQFRRNQKGLSDQIFENTAQLERRRLADEMTGLKRDYSRRGLLQSGIREGAQGKAQQRSASEMTQTRQDINRQIADQQRQLDLQESKKELGIMQTQAAMADQIQAQAIANMQTRSALYGDIGRSIGTIGGAYLGRRS